MVLEWIRADVRLHCGTSGNIEYFVAITEGLGLL